MGDDVVAGAAGREDEDGPCVVANAADGACLWDREEGGGSGRGVDEDDSRPAALLSDSNGVGSAEEGGMTEDYQSEL